MNLQKYIIHNCYNDVCEINLDLDKIKYIFKQTLSNDEILIVIDKENNAEIYDSDKYIRYIDYYNGIQMIYPEKIDIDNGHYYEPDETENFKYIGTLEEKGEH